MAANVTSPFSSSVFESRLKELNSTMQSIQDLSKWLIVNKKHAKTAVGIWFREIQKASSSNRKLTLIYLANDVVQNARRKGSEYKTEFVRALPRALHLIVKDKDPSVIKSVTRVISVWEERHVFDTEILAKFTSILSATRRSKSESSDVSRRASVEGAGLSVEPTPPPPEKPPNDKEPPTMEVLLKSISEVDGEKSAIQDMVLRQKIANFPTRLYEVDILSKLTTKESCEELLKELQEPLEVLSGYTERMEKELKQRNEIEEMLDSFIWSHQCLLHKAKERRKEYQYKMEQCLHVKESLKSHIASLPDLAAPNSDKLEPLPSVGDLFS